jgi:hypothetical protein
LAEIPGETGASGKKRPVNAEKEGASQKKEDGLQ